MLRRVRGTAAALYIVVTTFCITVCANPAGDLAGDGSVDFADVGILAQQRLDASCVVGGCGADLDGLGQYATTFVSPGEYMDAFPRKSFDVKERERRASG